LLKSTHFCEIFSAQMSIEQKGSGKSEKVTHKNKEETHKKQKKEN